MTIMKTASLAAVLAIAAGAASVTGATNAPDARSDAAAQTPEQRALALALSLADQARLQPKAAVVNGGGQTAPAALAAGVASATGSVK